jgi:Uri superfamily endonuclease
MSSLMKGAYILVLDLPGDLSVMIGKRGIYHFKKGYYVYVGSALNSLDQRIQRHLRRHKKIHWHIDYFLQFAEIVRIFYKINTQREECRIANAFKKEFKGIPNFGCSDCSCSSHLFSGAYEGILTKAYDLGMSLYVF